MASASEKLIGVAWTLALPCLEFVSREKMASIYGEVFWCRTRTQPPQAHAVLTSQCLRYVVTVECTQPKTRSRFDDVNVRDTVRNYSTGTFSWGSPIVWGLPYSSNRHVTPVSLRGRGKGLTCSIRAPPCSRFDTLRQSVSNRVQLFLAVCGFAIIMTDLRIRCHGSLTVRRSHKPEIV